MSHYYDRAGRRRFKGLAKLKKSQVYPIRFARAVTQPTSLGPPEVTKTKHACFSNIVEDDGWNNPIIEHTWVFLKMIDIYLKITKMSLTSKNVPISRKTIYIIVLGVLTGRDRFVGSHYKVAISGSNAVSLWKPMMTIHSIRGISINQGISTFDHNPLIWVKSIINYDDTS